MNTKQVIVWRKDLVVRKGKIAAQAAHASLAVFLDRKVVTKNGLMTLAITEEMQNWIDNSFTKVCVSCENEQQLMDLYNKAKEAGLPVSIITDNGRTEFHGVPTKTCIAVGPAEVSKVDAITGNLPLL